MSTGGRDGGVLLCFQARDDEASSQDVGADLRGDGLHRAGGIVRVLDRLRSAPSGRQERGDQAARSLARTPSTVELCSACARGRGQQLDEGPWRKSRTRWR